MPQFHTNRFRQILPQHATPHKSHTAHSHTPLSANDALAAMDALSENCRSSFHGTHQLRSTEPAGSAGLCNSGLNWLLLDIPHNSGTATPRWPLSKRRISDDTKVGDREQKDTAE